MSPWWRIRDNIKKELLEIRIIWHSRLSLRRKDKEIAKLIKQIFKRKVNKERVLEGIT